MGDNERDLDAISFTLGRNTEGLTNLNRLFEQHYTDDDRRHAENVAALRANTDAVGKLAGMLQPIAESVAFMRPIVDGYVVTRGKLALLASIGFGIVVAIGWVLEAGLKWVIGWLLNAKFGGP
jgi:hypothetical protein